MNLRTWALLTTLSTFLLMVIGAYVVKTGAGLSCPDWPSCVEGDWVPPFTEAHGFTQAQILSEWSHRLLAAVTGVLTIGLVVAARKAREHRDTWTLAVAAGGLLFAQILMGAATVRLGNAPWTV
ncbi:MAG TPA: COX15/CtaA family protein, partial [Candidatus Thermoplasmatota archaeon]|nr:COX15/CtaA family protein [Candidatus Thermoplasmatota archaeon]